MCPQISVAASVQASPKGEGGGAGSAPSKSGRLKMWEWKMRYGQKSKGVYVAGVDNEGVD